MLVIILKAIIDNSIELFNHKEYILNDSTEEKINQTIEINAANNMVAIRFFNESDLIKFQKHYMIL